MSIDEAAAALGISRRTLYRIVAERRLQTVKVSDRRQVLWASAVEAYARSRTERSA